MDLKMDSNDYEKLISSLSQNLTNDSLLREFGSKKFGKRNLWQGVSGFEHQIDASLASKKDILLIECKHWVKPIGAVEFLTFLSRLRDIKENPKYKGHKVRGALVSTKGWQSGVTTLVRYYAELCSVFQVENESVIVDMIHTHFVGVEGEGIPSAEAVGKPSVI